MLGIPVPTIRSWERRYDFPSPARTGGRRRRYTISEIESLRAVRDGITRGHPTREAVALVRAAEGAPIDRIEFLDRFTEGATLLDAEKLRAALEDATHLIGVERAITEVAMPGMHEMGDRWRTGLCDVANEHVATQVVRGWLSRLDAQSPPPFHRRPIVLACGPGGTAHDRDRGIRGGPGSPWLAVRAAGRDDSRGLPRYRDPRVPRRGRRGDRTAQREPARGGRSPEHGERHPGRHRLLRR